LFVCSEAGSREKEEEEEEDEEDIMQSDDGAHSWLQDLGLDKAQFRSLDPNKVKLYPSCPCPSVMRVSFY